MSFQHFYLVQALSPFINKNAFQNIYVSQKWSTSLVTKYQQKGLPKHLCIPKVELKP
ncbi:hypothetical protein RHGRI_003039 [Rhododendron griersonianum]|uniref:Uncharacterized protein n=1 Tax=Rhododendron griersonianum TaxID=479676 RepID=A0AAV6LTW8_9ERIC|nr:hypothetical protein RHGRI_003039 [Rhododendron griersonianum]